MHGVSPAEQDERSRHGNDVDKERGGDRCRPDSIEVKKEEECGDMREKSEFGDVTAW
jgi:hypothetical protein